MPKSISLDTHLKIKSKKDWLGTTVPWEVTGALEDLVASETVGGVFDLSSWSTIKVEGADARDFLNRMSSTNFKTLKEHSVNYGTFLTGKGTVVSAGFFLQASPKDTFHFIVNPSLETSTLEHLEKFHFAEKLTISSESGEWALLGWWNPQKSVLDELHLEPTMPSMVLEWRRWKSLDFHFWKDSKRPNFYWIWLARKQVITFFFELQRMGVPVLGHSTFEYHRIKAAVPEFGIELTEKEIVLESGFEDFVSRNKGCYPGQEVVERIFTYGSVNKKLLPVKVSGIKGKTLSLPLALEQGSLVSVAANPRQPNEGVGLAYLLKSVWETKQSFSTEGIEVTYQP